MSQPRRGHEPAPEHEHEFEAELGLPEPLPEGERILWQGSPDAWQLALRRFHVRKIAWYFAGILLLRVLFLRHDGEAWAAIARTTLALGSLAVLAVATLGLIAYLSARGAVYTITNRRVVLRIGIVLTLTFNLPYRALADAALNPGKDGIGDVALTLPPADKIAWVHLWPHSRPWQVARPEPQLCCLPDAPKVAHVLREAWIAACGAPRGCSADAPVELAPAAAGTASTAPARQATPAARPRSPAGGALPQGARS